MSTPQRMKTWVEATTSSRPWEDNDVTRQLAALIPNQEMAAVIWALQRQHALDWIKKPIPALHGNSILSLITTNDGEEAVWVMLEASSMWL